MNDPRLHTEGAENTFTHEVLILLVNILKYVIIKNKKQV